MNHRYACAVALVLAACGSSNTKVSMSVRTGSAASTTSRPGRLTVGSGVQISRIRVVLSDIKLESDHGNSNDNSDDQPFHTGPTVIDLSGAALDTSTATTVMTSDIPAGRYGEVKFKIHKAKTTDAGNAALAEMAALNASVAVEGTIDAVAFTFTSSLEAEQKYEHNVTIGNGSNLTLNIDPTGWFGASAAARLDPRVAGNRSQIEEAIKTSFKLFEDDDRDGHEDKD
jgi:hypothetical protein